MDLLLYGVLLLLGTGLLFSCPSPGAIQGRPTLLEGVWLCLWPLIFLWTCGGACLYLCAVAYRVTLACGLGKIEAVSSAMGVMMIYSVAGLIILMPRIWRQPTYRRF